MRIAAPSTPAGNASRTWSHGSAARPTPPSGECGQRHRRAAMQQRGEPQRRGDRWPPPAHRDRSPRRGGRTGGDARASPSRTMPPRRRPAGATRPATPAPRPRPSRARAWPSLRRGRHGERRRHQHRDADAVERVLLAPRARVGVAWLEAARVEVGVGPRRRSRSAGRGRRRRPGCGRSSGSGARRRSAHRAPPPRRCSRATRTAAAAAATACRRGCAHAGASPVAARGPAPARHRPGQEPTRAGVRPTPAAAADASGTATAPAAAPLPMPGRDDQADEAERRGGAGVPRATPRWRRIAHGRSGHRRRSCRTRRRRARRPRPPAVRSARHRISARHRDGHPLTTAAVIAGPAPRPPAGS